LFFGAFFAGTDVAGAIFDGKILFLYFFLTGIVLEENFFLFFPFFLLFFFVSPGA
jgi:hypothetical protein